MANGVWQMAYGNAPRSIGHNNVDQQTVCKQDSLQTTKRKSDVHKNLLTKAQIDEMEGLQKKHFLNADAQRVNKSLGDRTGMTGLGFHIISVPPGKHSTEFHRHYFEDECVYVLSGSATATIGDDSFEIGPGDFVGYPAGGEAHDITNTGTEDFVCIVAGQRLSMDVADYPRLRKRLFRTPGRPWEVVDESSIDNPVAGKK